MHLVLQLCVVMAFSSSSRPADFLSFLTRLLTAFSLHLSSPSAFFQPSSRLTIGGLKLDSIEVIICSSPGDSLRAASGRPFFFFFFFYNVVDAAVQQQQQQQLAAAAAEEHARSSFLPSLSLSGSSPIVYACIYRSGRICFLALSRSVSVTLFPSHARTHAHTCININLRVYVCIEHCTAITILSS